jgi:hypothetical protein
MIKLLPLLRESKLVPLRSKERKDANIERINKIIQDYIDGGSKGNLNLRNTLLTSLPQGLEVGGDLWLSYTKISSLPQGLKVGGGLSLSNTPIQSLPDTLKVGGNLDLSRTPITSLPQGLEVGGYLYLNGTPLSKTHTEEQIKQMCPGVKGKIYL